MDFNYEVTITNTFDAQDSLDAVRQMIDYLESEDLSGLTYKVQIEHQDAVDYISGSEAQDEDEDEDEEGDE
jgi:hypothetical protein